MSDTMTPAEKLAADKKVRKSRKLKSARDAQVECLMWEKRTSLGLNQSDVANATGFSRQAVVLWEQGHPVTLLNARKIAAFFGCTVDEIWP